MAERTYSGEAGPYSHHIPSLDGLRGLAVLAVMCSHLFPGTTTSGLLLRSLGASLEFGAAGVDLFFVLSGFLITGILFDSLSESRYFRKFYARRALRIFPLYYGVLIVFFILTPWLGIRWHGMNLAFLFYLQNTNIAGQFYSFEVLGHLWSLAVEEQFYMIWPLAVFFIRDIKRLLWTCLALSCVSILLRFFLALHHTVFHVINRGTLTRMDSLLIGAALALLLRTRFHDSILRWAKIAFLFVVVVVASLNIARSLVESNPAWLFNFDSTYLAVRYTLIAMGSASLIAWCLRPSSNLCRFFEGDILRFFGKYSYGLYVLHFVARDFLLKTFKKWISIVTPNKMIGVAGAGFLLFIVAIVAAYASYNLYEKYFLRLKHHFDYDRSEILEAPEFAATP